MRVWTGRAWCSRGLRGCSTLLLLLRRHRSSPWLRTRPCLRRCSSAAAAAHHCTCCWGRRKQHQQPSAPRSSLTHQQTSSSCTWRARPRLHPWLLTRRCLLLQPPGNLDARRRCPPVPHALCCALGGCRYGCMFCLFGVGGFVWGLEVLFGVGGFVCRRCRGALTPC